MSVERRASSVERRASSVERVSEVNTNAFESGLHSIPAASAVPSSKLPTSSNVTASYTTTLSLQLSRISTPTIDPSGLDDTPNPLATLGHASSTADASW